MNLLATAPLIATTAISLLLVKSAWQRRPAAGSLAFLLMMLGLAVWSLSLALRSLIFDLHTQVFWTNFANTGILAIPTAWLVLSLAFTNREKWLMKRNLAWLLLEPAAALVLIWTNPSHHLFWKNIHLVLDEGFPNLAITYGPAYWLHMLYSYTLLVTGALVLLWFILRSPRLYRSQALALIIGAFTPWIGNIIYLFGKSDIFNQDPTPLIYALTSPILAWGLFRYRLMDIVPVAYDSIIENMRDGVIVLDVQKRVVAMNAAAQKRLGLVETECIGLPAEEVFASWPEFVEKYRHASEARTEFTISRGTRESYYELNILPIKDKRQRDYGVMIITHNITERKRAEQILRSALDKTEALYRVSRSLIASESLPEMLKATVDGIIQGLPAERVILSTFDLEQKKITNFITGGAGSEQIAPLTFDELMQGLSGWVVRTGKPVMASREMPDSRESPTERKWREETNCGSILAAPMFYHERILGTITAINRPDQPNFTERDEELILAMANQAAIAVENARLYQSEHQQRERAETLGDVASIINASLNQQQVLQLILEQLARVMAYDSASIMLLFGRNLVIVAQRKFRSKGQQFTPLKVELLPHFQEAIEERHPVIIPDTTRDPRWQYLKDSAHIRCWLGVPLIGQRQVLGLLNLDKEQPGYYTQQDARLAEAFANHAAVAIENARLFESAQRRAQEAETLRQATAAVLGTLNQDEAIERILQQLSSVVPFDSASVQLLRDDYLEIVGGRGWVKPSKVNGLRFPVPGNNPNTLVIQKRQPIILGNNDPSFSPSKDGPNDHSRSWLGVPLIVHERVIGMLALDSNKPGRYNEKHARLASAFADQVAIAIENARLYATEQQRVNEADALRATLADISAELELPKLLQAILERATTLLNATGGDLGLYDQEKQEVVVVSSYNMGKDNTGSSMALGKGALGKVAESCLPLIIEDYAQWEGRIHQFREMIWHATIAVPMLIGGRLVGVIGIVDTDPKRQFSSSDQRLLNFFAQQAAIAVENARLYQSARGAAERSVVLHKVSQEIVAASLDPEGIYTAIHRAASQLMPTEAFALTLYDEGSQMIEAVYLVDRLGRAPFQRVPANRGLSGQVIASGKSVYIEDLLQEYDDTGQLRVDAIHYGDEVDVRSILAVPMRLGGKVIGMLSTQSYDPHAYSSEDQHLLETLASYAAIALENSRLFKEVQRLAITDPLTEVYNRRQLFELGQREFNRARRFNRSMSIIMIDIDHFKLVNDTYGHAAGDRVLHALAQQIQSQVREIDILGRYGGEEFTIVLPETDLIAAQGMAERLRAQIFEVLGKPRNDLPAITISVGVSELNPEISDLAALIDHADAALYDAKRGGRNRVAAR